MPYGKERLDADVSMAGKNQGILDPCVPHAITHRIGFLTNKHHDHSNWPSFELIYKRSCRAFDFLTILVSLISPNFKINISKSTWRVCTATKRDLLLQGKHKSTKNMENEHHEKSKTLKIELRTPQTYRFSKWNWNVPTDFLEVFIWPLTCYKINVSITVLVDSSKLIASLTIVSHTCESRRFDRISWSTNWCQWHNRETNNQFSNQHISWHNPCSTAKNTFFL